MLKKAMILSSAIALTGLAHAGAYQCKPGDVKVPCEMSAWDVGADALIFEQRGGIDQTLADFDMAWKWGFRLEGGYHWGTGHDMNVNWAHYNNTTTNNVTQQQINNGSTSPLDLNPGLISINSAFDIINVEFGQHVDFGKDWDIRFHAGVQGAYLRNGASGPNYNVGSFRPGVFKTNGWGPRAGADIAYNMSNGLAFFSDGSFSVLTSTFSANKTNGTGRQGSNFIGMTETAYKLGAKYIQAMAQGDLTWRVAWEGHYFIGAIPPNLNEGDNIMWDGVSFGLKWLGQA